MSDLKRTYQRSQILSYFDLNEHQQRQATEQLDEQAEEDRYVLWNDEPLPLCMFMRIDNKLFHGHYGLTAFSCYFIRINRTNEEATVVYAHC